MGELSQEQQDPRGQGPSPLRFIGAGFELAVPLLLGVFGGYGLDRRFETTPWLMLAGAFLGGAAGMLSFYRRVVPPRGGGPGGMA